MAELDLTEAIEAAAKVLAYEAEEGSDCKHVPWEANTEDYKAIFRLSAREVLTAALPPIERQLRVAERVREVVGAAKAWRNWFPSADSMFVPENALIAAVDALDREELLAAGVRFWTCPVNHPGPWRLSEVRQTVEWRGDVAHCLEPGCGKTSAAETPEATNER